MFASLLTRLADNDLSALEDGYSFSKLPSKELIDELKLVVTSCARIPNMEKIEQINKTVLNYGIDIELTNSENEEDLRIVLINAITRFEPRLSELVIECVKTTNYAFEYLLRGLYHTTTIVLDIQWNKRLKQFTFDE